MYSCIYIYVYICICTHIYIYMYTYVHELRRSSCMRHRVDMSAVSHSRHVCCVTHQTRLPCHTSDMSAVLQRAGMSTVSHKDMCAVSHSWLLQKSTYFFWPFANSQDMYVTYLDVHEYIYIYIEYIYIYIHIYVYIWHRPIDE